MVDALCQRWGCLPSQVLAEDADYVLRMLQLVAPLGESMQSVPAASADDPLARLAELQQAAGN